MFGRSLTGSWECESINSYVVVLEDTRNMKHELFPVHLRMPAKLLLHAELSPASSPSNKLE